MADKFQTVAEFQAATGEQITPPSEQQDAPVAHPTVADWEKSSNKSALQQSFYTQAEKTPDRQAEILKLAKEQNVAPAFVERNFDDLSIKSRRKAADFTELADAYPASTEFLKDPANTALARDDVDNLKQTENAVKKHVGFSELIVNLMKARQQVEREDGQSTWEWITDSYAVGQAKLVEGALKIPAFIENTYNALTGAPPAQGKSVLLDNEMLTTTKAVGQLYRENVVELDKSVSDLISKKDYSTAGKALVAQGLSNAHQQVVSLMVGLGVSRMAGAMLPGLTTAADVSEESLAKGATPGQAALNATLQGSIEVVAERLGTFGLLDHWEKSLTKTYSKAVSQEVMKEFFKPLVAAALGEASEEAITSIAQDLSSYATGVDKDALKGSGQRAIDAGLGGAFMGVVMGGAGAAGKAQARAEYLRQAESAKELYKSLGEAASESKVRERLPEKHREFVEKATKNGPVENVYIPIEEFQTYFQSKKESPAAFANKIGVGKAFDEAVKTGGDLQVPLAQWTEGVVGTEHYEAFENNVKFNPADLTVKQAEAAKVEAEAALKATEAEATVDKTAELLKGYEAQLRELGVKDPMQARLLAGLGGLAQKQGIDPVEFYNELNLSIGRGQAPEAGAMSMDQDNKPIAPAFFSKLEQTVTEKMGNAATVEQINGMLKEIKPEERKWLGVDEFLQGKDKVTKQELLDIVRANALNIQEITKSENIALPEVQLNEKLTFAEPEKIERWVEGRSGRTFKEVKVWRATDIFEGYLIEQHSPKKFVISNRGGFIVDEFGKFGKLEDAKAYLQKAADQRLKEKAENEAKAAVRPKFEKYVLPGGENYREMLFTLPEAKSTDAPITQLPEGYKTESYKPKITFGDEGPDTIKWRVLKPDGETLLAGYASEEEVISRSIRKLNGLKQSEVKSKDYRSGHFKEANILAHTRVNERVDSEGKKVLFLEEVQSDWHQEGRKQGYKDEAKPKGLKVKEVKENGRFFEVTDENGVFVTNVIDDGSFKKLEVNAENALKIAQERVDGGKTAFKSSAVPDAPFKKTWHEFVLKRMIREAAEKGFDKIAWTTGEQQTDRYDLAKQVDEVQAAELMDGTFQIDVFKQSRKIESQKVAKEGLEAALGKDLAAKIIAKEGKDTGEGSLSYSGVDLKVGGEGMKGFYDKMIPSFLSKFGKKYNAKVGMTKVAAATDKPSNEMTDQELLQDLSGDGSGFVLVHSMEITPELRDAALGEGFSMFQKDEEDLRGQIRFGKKSIQIELFEKMDYSTFIHETGHLYLEAINKLSNKENASEQVKADLATILDWLGVKSFDEVKTEQHEKFADGFMNFVAEGKAPTKALRGVFRRFKLWVMSVATKLRMNQVQLTPEVRDVMSRMLASEQEVSKAVARTEFGPLFDAPIAVGMNEEQALKYRKAEQEARDFAVAEVNAELMREMKKKQSVEQKAARKEITEQVEKEVNASLAFRAVSILQKNELPDGTKLPDNTEPLKIGKLYLTDEQRAMLPRGVTAPDGYDPNIAAGILGFRDGEQLLESLASTPKQKDFIEAETNKRMAEQFPDLLTDPVLPEKAVEELHNDKRAEMLSMELEHLASNNMPQLKDAIRKITRRPPLVQDIRAEAESLIGAKPISQLKPHLYSRAEIKAAKEAGALLAKGDIDGAFLAKRRELFNHELFRAAVEAKAKVVKATEKFKDIARRSDEDISKTRDTDIANAAKAVIAQLQGDDQGKPPESYLEKIKKYDPDTYNVVMTLVDSATEYQGDPRDLSFDDFMDVADSVNALWSLAKTSKQIEIDGKKMDREEITAELNAKLSEYSKPGNGGKYNKTASDKEKAKVLLLGARAALIRTEQWADTVDVESNGPFRRYIYEPIAKATAEYRQAKGEVLKKYETMLKDWAKDLPKSAKEKIDSPELGFSFKDKTQLIGALLHTGNQSNFSKMLRGNKGVNGRTWGDIEDDGQVSSRRWDAFVERMIQTGQLTKADFDLVQNIWNLMEELKPGAQKAHKSAYGYYFNEITANEFTNRFGTYRGGYVPAKVDIHESEDAKIRKDREEFEKNNNSFQFPTTGRGFTKSRNDAYAAPLMLDLSLVGGHIDSVLRFTHIEPRVKEVARVVNDEGFRQMLAENLDPTIASEMLVPWLQRAATQKVVLPSEDGLGKILDPMARFLRRNVAMQFMVGNVTNTIQQVTGLIVAASKVKPKYLRNALVTYMASIRKTTDAVVEKSLFMKTTQGSNIYETQQAIEEIVANPSWIDDTKAFAIKHTYFLQSAAQNMVNTVVWTAAYDQSIAQGNRDEQAVKDADRAVRLTQGTNLPEDISRFETGTATKRLFTQFAGYFNMLANLNGGELMKISRDVGMRKGAGRAFYIYLTAFALPAIMSEVLVRVMAGEPPDADDDDEYLDDALSVFFGSQFNTMTAMIPWGGQVANTALKRFNDKQYDDRLSLSPVVSTIESMAGIPAEVYKAITEGTANKKRVVKDVLMLMGVATSLPIGPVGRPVGYLMDVAEGEAEPTGPIDFTRGLVSGKKGKE